MLAHGVTGRVSDCMLRFLTLGGVRFKLGPAAGRAIALAASVGKWWEMLVLTLPSAVLLRSVWPLSDPLPASPPPPPARWNGGRILHGLVI